MLTISYSSPDDRHQNRDISPPPPNKKPFKWRDRGDCFSGRERCFGRWNLYRLRQHHKCKLMPRDFVKTRNSRRKSSTRQYADNEGWPSSVEWLASYHSWCKSCFKWVWSGRDSAFSPLYISGHTPSNCNLFLTLNKYLRTVKTENGDGRLTEKNHVIRLGKVNFYEVGIGKLPIFSK